MASKSSGSLAPGASYSLGDYTFTLSNVVSEGERVLQAHCSGPEGNAAGGITVPTSAQLQSWSVEADETEATVYAQLKGKGNIPCAPTADLNRQIQGSGNTFSFLNGTGSITISASSVGSPTQTVLMASGSPGAVVDMYAKKAQRHDTIALNSTYAYDGKTVYYAIQTSSDPTSPVVSASPTYDGPISGDTAWAMIYGGADSSRLVTRFPIDIREAGGGWGDSGDPMTTLHVVVTGALSGRHNDPTASAEGSEFYSYVPADNAKEAWYGCGGDGGYGGGGGAGASTIIINEFPTSRAGNKDLQANARRHGYGSGGGKGANGGDGCILIYYSTPVPPNP